MIRRIKNLKLLTGKKRYFVMGFLALELLSLPAAAHIVHSAATEPRPVVTAVEVPTSEPGVSRFLVMSNNGFSVEANQLSGDVKTSVYVNGALNGGNRFGDKAQLPGPKTLCANSMVDGSAIYKANRQTAAEAGTPVEEAVIFEFNYDADARPDFEFIAGTKSKAEVTACQA